MPDENYMAEVIQMRAYYAEQIEWLGKHRKRGDPVIVSTIEKKLWKMKSSIDSMENTLVAILALEIDDE